MDGGAGLYGESVRVKKSLTRRIPTIVCAANLGLCVGYWAFERTLPKGFQPPLGKEARDVEGWSKRYFGLKSVFQLYVHKNGCLGLTPKPTDVLDRMRDT